MKKSILKTTLASAVTSFVMVTGVNAATSGNVLTLTAMQDAGTGVITFSGTADLDVLAASCSLRDANDAEVIFGSTSVDSGVFGGEFTAEVADYTLKCANYNGGVWVSAQIIAPVASTPSEQVAEEESEASPETGRFTGETGSANTDGTVMAIATAGGAVLVAGAATAIIMKRRKAQKQ